MTANIVLLSILMLWLLWHVGAVGRIASGKTIPWLPLAVVTFCLLPMTFGGFVVISSYVFESTTDKVAWFGFVAAALLSACAVLFWKNRRNIPARTAVFHASVWSVCVGWSVLALTRSHYEQGRTPKVTDSPYDVVHWVSAHLLAIVLLADLFAGREYRKSWLRYIAATGLAVIYLSVAWNALAEGK